MTTRLDEVREELGSPKPRSRTDRAARWLLEQVDALAENLRAVIAVSDRDTAIYQRAKAALAALTAPRERKE